MELPSDDFSFFHDMGGQRFPEAQGRGKNLD